MLVYHGSDMVVNEPKILDANRPLDFGGGFYLTTSKEQAERWAARVSFRNATGSQCVNRYEFDLDGAKKALSVRIFDQADEEWLDFICANRSGVRKNDYDVVIGPVADDRVYRVVVEYENGDIDKEYAIKQLRAEQLCDQISMRSQKALAYLTYLGTEVKE